MSNRTNVLKRQLSPYTPIETPHYEELRRTVAAMTQLGKGLLAADESVGSVTKRFAGLGLENTAENRRRYRALMLGAPGIESYVSGVIFHEETLSQKMDGGLPFPAFCNKLGIVAGIKTDRGLVDFPEGAPGEQATEGLDGYLGRARGFYAQGARFCKWRNVYRIQNDTVSEAVLHHNANTLARYAVLSQLAGLVPIVEPEVMIDGKHTLETCRAVSQRVWSRVTQALHEHGVLFDCMLLKPNMIVPGAETSPAAPPAVVAAATIHTLARTLPATVAGVTFLSGGLSEVRASEYLNAMNLAAPAPVAALPRPWRLTFSYARALQSSALKVWGGKEENVKAARTVFLHRAKMNSLASQGKYKREEDSKQSESLYVKGHTY